MDSTLEKNFESTFRDNIVNGEKYSSYEYEFEKLHKSQFDNNLYEEIEKIGLINRKGDYIKVTMTILKFS